MHILCCHLRFDFVPFYFLFLLYLSEPLLCFVCAAADDNCIVVNVWLHFNHSRLVKSGDSCACLYLGAQDFCTHV